MNVNIQKAIVRWKSFSSTLFSKYFFLSFLNSLYYFPISFSYRMSEMGIKSSNRGEKQNKESRGKNIPERNIQFSALSSTDISLLLIFHVFIHRELGLSIAPMSFDALSATDFKGIRDPRSLNAVSKSIKHFACTQTPTHSYFISMHI